MNSIRRPRSRPRVDSVSFASLWWVLVREAFVRALDLPLSRYATDGRWRRHIAKLDTDEVRWRLEHFLVRHPERRIVP